MKIKKQLILSHTIISLIVVVIIFVFIYSLLHKVNQLNTKVSEESMLNISNETLKVSEKTVRDFAEEQVELYAKKIAYELALELKSHNLKDYTALRQSQKLREIATQDIITRYGKSGYVDVFDRKGEIIWHQNSSIEGRNYSEWADEYPKMWELAQKSYTQDLVKDYYSFIDESYRSRQRYVAVVHIPGTNFNLSAVVNIIDYFYPVEQQIKKINENASEKALKGINQISKQIFKRAYIIFFMIILVSVLFAIYISIKLSDVTAKPIIALRHSVKNMGDGDLTSKTKVQGSDEIKELAENFNRLGDQLTEYIDKLQDETAKRQSVESELAIASEIQQSILPRVFPPFPGRDEFDLYSIMHPAKEVGGDFYDFFFYDHDTFVFLVGDVSGKGVPAALFMMLCRTLLHSTASESKDPAAVLKKVNNVLAQENDTNMFVTVFLAYYFVDSGKIVYSNAGHLPALKVKENNEIEELSSDNSVAMGIFSDVEFSTSESTLAINDKFVLYTDGITEAVSAEEEFYGMERFIDYFKTNKHLSSKQDCANILEQIMSFQQDNQYDDITLSVFKRLT